MPERWEPPTTPLDKSEVRRIWMKSGEALVDDDYTLHVIKTSSGLDRFSVPLDHPHYDHYMRMWQNDADKSGWVTKPTPPDLSHITEEDFTL